jgi:hypothetical protein
MTSDGHHIVGPVPSAEGFFALSGCNVAGLSISPALGDAVADVWPRPSTSPRSLKRANSGRSSSALRTHHIRPFAALPRLSRYLKRAPISDIDHGWRLSQRGS